MSTDSVYLENLDEFINDENKIVTFKWLSATLNVHVNVAKQMLFEFTQIQRNEKENDKLNVIYFVAGTAKISGVLLVQLVPEEMLDAFKKTLSCVMSCHIYSVQRSKVKDPSLLFAADYDQFKGQSLSSRSAISYSLAKQRSSEEVAQLKSLAQPTTQAPDFRRAVPPNASSSISSKKSKGIASMFSKGPEKKDEKKEKPEVKQEKEVKETPVQKEDKTKNSMAAFFSKQASKPKASEPEREPQEPKTMKESAKPVRKPDLKKKKKALSDEEELPRKEKKRRRIQTTVFDSSSSSEEEEEDIDMEDPIPPTPPPPPPREPSPILPESPVKPKLALNGNEACATGAKRRVRKRKLVSKHTTTPDGYMQTEKVWEDYSTDEEEPIPKKKPETQNAAQKKPAAKMTKTSPNKGTKQMSLTNFFKKK